MPLHNRNENTGNKWINFSDFKPKTCCHPRSLSSLKRAHFWWARGTWYLVVFQLSSTPSSTASSGQALNMASYVSCTTKGRTDLVHRALSCVLCSERPEAPSQDGWCPWIRSSHLVAWGAAASGRGFLGWMGLFVASLQAAVPDVPV